MINNVNKKDILIFTHTDLISIDKQVEEMQCIYHPQYSADGMMQLNFWYLNMLKKQGKEIVIDLDRNIFTDIVKVARQGKINDGDTLRKVALLMAWSEINQLSILPYDAIAENARKYQNNTEANAEMYCFDFVMKNVSANVWLDVARGRKERIEPIVDCDLAMLDSKINFCRESVDYLYHYAAMIHLARVARSGLSWEEQFKQFLQWYCDNSLVCQYVLGYVIIYYSNQNKVKLPKHAMSNDINKVKEGCKNQARDLCYLSEINRVYDNDRYKDYVVLFATFDYMLGRIFSSCHKINDVRELFSHFSNGKDKELYNFYVDLISNHKTKEIADHVTFCRNLIEEEEQLLVDGRFIDSSINSSIEMQERAFE